MEKTRKILSIVTLTFTGIVSLLLILWLFNVDFLGANKLKIYLTLGSIAVGGFFAINSLNMVIKNKLIGWVSLGLISSAVLFVILTSWINLFSSPIGNIMMSIALLSVLFNIIVSSGLDLGKSHLAVQIIVYILAFVVDIISTLAIFGAVNIWNIPAIFWSLIILTVVGIVILKVLAKKRVGTEIVDEKEMIKISKSEYEILVAKAKKYDELIAQNHENKDTN